MADIPNNEFQARLMAAGIVIISWELHGTRACSNGADILVHGVGWIGQPLTPGKLTIQSRNIEATPEELYNQVGRIVHECGAFLWWDDSPESPVPTPPGRVSVEA
jgi:hypothetical protein